MPERAPPRTRTGPAWGMVMCVAASRAWSRVRAATGFHRARGAFGKRSMSQDNLRDGVGSGLPVGRNAPVGRQVSWLTASRARDIVSRRDAKANARARTVRLTFPAFSGLVKGGRFVEEEASNPADHEATPVAFPAEFQTACDRPMQSKASRPSARWRTLTVLQSRGRLR
ncbi:hypothetical protein D9M72_520050 [compost metagenome]